jgi:hypothetical protein
MALGGSLAQDEDGPELSLLGEGFDACFVKRFVVGQQEGKDFLSPRAGELRKYLVRSHDRVVTLDGLSRMAQAD